MIKFAIIALAFLAGCATYTPAKQRDIQKSATVQQDFDKAWSSVVRNFADKNITIKNIEKASGLITTDTKTFDPFNNGDYIDCGKLSGLSAAQMTGSAIYNVFVEKIDTKNTKVTINLKAQVTSTVQTGYGNTSSASRDCFSTGKFEAEFLQALK